MLKIQIIYQKIQKNKTNSIQNNIPEAGRQTLVSMERHGLHHSKFHVSFENGHQTHHG